MKLPFMYKCKKKGCHWTILLVLGVAVIGWVITAFANLAETNSVREFLSHESSNCPGGEKNHFDDSLLSNDSLGGGAAAAGRDGAVRIVVEDFVNSLAPSFNSETVHETAHGFGMPDFYDLTCFTPESGSVMMAGPTSGESTITDGDTWLIRRIWKKRKSLRGW